MLHHLDQDTRPAHPGSQALAAPECAHCCCLLRNLRLRCLDILLAGGSSTAEGATSSPCITTTLPSSSSTSGMMAAWPHKLPAAHNNTGTTQHSTTNHSTAQHSTPPPRTRHSTAQHSTAPHRTVSSSEQPVLSACSSCAVGTDTRSS